MYYYNKRFTLGFICTLPLLFHTLVEAAPIYNANGNKLYLDGRVIARRIISDNDKTNGDKTRLRLNVHGETQISPTFYAYGRFERDFNGYEAENSVSTDYTRFAYAGLSDTNWGSFDYGRNSGTFFKSLYTIAMFPVNGGGTYKVDNFIMGKRGNGMFTWRKEELFEAIPGLALTLQYQGKNDDSSRSIQTQNGDGYGIAFAYVIPDTKLELSSAWGSSTLTDRQQQKYDQGDKADGWIVGAKWQPGHWTLSGFYSETHNMQFINASRGFANKAQTMEAGISYRFQHGLLTAVGYRESKANDIRGMSDAYLVKDTLLLATYFLNSNFSLSAEYRLNMLEKDNALGLSSDDATWLTATFIF